MASIIGSRSGGYIGYNPSIGTSGAGGVWGIKDVQVNSSSWPPLVGGLTTPIEIFGTRDTVNGTAYAPTLSQYTSAGLTYPAMVSYAFSSGFHFFTVPAGTFTVTIKGAEGSGTQHGYGAHITATMILDAPTRLVALVGTAGAGSYTGGGGTFLAVAGSGDSYSTATALLVAGGGGGGYVSLGAYSDAGDTSWSSTSKRTNNTDCSANGGGVYDGGASFGNFFTVGMYSCTTTANAAQNFIAGGRGGIGTDCGSGSANQGGFGGGGGSCPAGGGGYYGGAPGGNSPTNTGGGGGTSYRLTSGSARITAWSTVGTNGSGRSSNPGTSHGYLKIQNAA